MVPRLFSAAAGTLAVGWALVWGFTAEAGGRADRHHHHQTDDTPLESRHQRAPLSEAEAAAAAGSHRESLSAAGVRGGAEVSGSERQGARPAATQPRVEKPAGGRPTAWKMETLRTETQLGLTAMVVSPMCFESGVGWVWDSASPPPKFVVKTENKRWFLPQPLLQDGSSAAPIFTWERNESKVPLYTSPDALGLLKAGQLYHFMWPFLSSLAAAEFVSGIARGGAGGNNVSLPRRAQHSSSSSPNSSTTSDPDLSLRHSDDFFAAYSGCPSAYDWRQYTWLGKAWAGGVRELLGGHCIGNLTAESRLRDTRIALLTGLTGNEPLDVEMAGSGGELGGVRRIHCYRRGVVGAVDMRYLAHRFTVTKALFTGRVRCGGSCKYRRLHVEYPEFLAQVRRRLHRSMEAVYGVPYPMPHTDDPGFGAAALGCSEVAIINRRGARSITNVDLLAASAEASGHSVRVLYFESMSALEQYRAVMRSHVVVGVHGSALAWCLVGPSRSVWVELAPRDSGRTPMYPNPNVFAVDAVGLPKVPKRGKRKTHANGLEGYGVLVRYAASHHISWSASCPLCSVCPVRAAATTRDEAIAGLSAWKTCNVTLPVSVFTAMLSEAAKVRASAKACATGCTVPVQIPEDMLIPPGGAPGTHNASAAA